MTEDWETKNQTCRRKIRIPFKIHPYRQKKEFSCGASCLLMILNAFRPNEYPLTYEKENSIHREIKYESADFENGAKMIEFLIKRRFRVKYFYYINEAIINSPPPNISEEEWQKYLKEFFETLELVKKQGAEIFTLSNNVNEALNQLIEELEVGHPIICEIQPPRSFITHSIIIRGLENCIFLVMDPLASNVFRRIHLNELKNSMQITYGSGNIYGWNFLVIITEQQNE